MLGELVVPTFVPTAALGTDMRRFPTAGHLLSWAGLVPRLDENAGKRRSTRIRKGAPWLKPVLVQCAWAAARKKSSWPAAIPRYELAERIPPIRRHSFPIVVTCPIVGALKPARSATNGGPEPRMGHGLPFPMNGLCTTRVIRQEVQFYALMRLRKGGG